MALYIFLYLKEKRWLVIFVIVFKCPSSKYTWQKGRNLEMNCHDDQKSFFAMLNTRFVLKPFKNIKHLYIIRHIEFGTQALESK